MKLRLIFALASATILVVGCAISSEKVSTTSTKSLDEILTPRAERIKADMTFLSSDDLKGREPGTEGHARAVQYVIDQFEAIGVEPMGDRGGFRQEIDFATIMRAEDGNSIQLFDADGQSIPFQDGEDYVVSASKQFPNSLVEAPLVFIGYGIVSPEYGLDPYEGVDVDGKIVVRLAGTPGGIQTEERAYLGAQVAREMSERGAVGVLSVVTPQSAERYPFAKIVSSSVTRLYMGWKDEMGETYTTAPNLKAGGSISDEGARKLFENAQMSWEEMLDLIADETATIPSFDLPLKARIQQSSIHGETTANNVIGIIEGSDPVLKNEVIALSAHIDHIGLTKKSMEEDIINNGALDNAAGVSTLLEAARILKSGEPPRRSILFTVVTAEEKGLLGAQYFTLNPTIDAARIVANVNLDMPVLTYDFKDVVAFGGERSTMKATIESVIGKYGVTLGEDPFPTQGLFTRSDHYRFVEIGVPSVFLATGFANGGEEAWANHFAMNYHKPSDEIDNGILFNVADKFASINAEIALSLANQDERPLWKKDDFFALKFGGAMQEE